MSSERTARRESSGHPFMRNSLPDAKAAMLKAIDALFEQIPADHRCTELLSLPDAIPSEAELRAHLIELLSKNISCEDNLSFLGGECWRHYVPAVCDEIVGRSEFLTSVGGTSSANHGRNQAWFEFCIVKAYAWARAMGAEGITEASDLSVLVNNCMEKELLKVRGVSRSHPDLPGWRMDMTRYSLGQLDEDTGVTAADVQQRMVDFGIDWIAVLRQISDEAYSTPDIDDPERWVTTRRASLRKQRNSRSEKQDA